MSAFLPAPPTIVVFSLSIITFLARPSILIVTFFEVGGDHGTARKDRNILEDRLTAIAEPGAFTAATLRPPRSLLTTSVASASPSMSLCYCACRRHQGYHRMKRRLRHVADFWAALGQAVACQYSLTWGVGRKEQWRELRAIPIR
jgi:hypothetical protein